MSQGSGWVTHPWVADGRGRLRFGIFNGPLGDWGALLDWVRAVEDLGFDSFWIGDHTTLFPLDCWTALAALATRTRRLRLGSLVSCVYYRPPTLLARMAADVDRLSGGRLVLGIGAGDYAPEFAQIGVPFPPLAERQAALAETVEIVRGVWDDAPFTFDGAHFRVAGAAVRPGPVQQPRVPLLIAGGGERVTLAQVARYADASNFGPSGVTGSAWGPDAVRRKYAALREHCSRTGRPYDSVLRTFLSYVVVARSDAGVQAKLAVRGGPALAEAPRIAGMPRELRTHHALPTPDEIPLLVVAGTPAEVAAYFRVLADAGVQYVIAQCGSDPETVRLLAEEVMPVLGAA